MVVHTFTFVTYTYGTDVHQMLMLASLPSPTWPPGCRPLATCPHVLCVHKDGQQLLELVHVQVIIIIVVINNRLALGWRLHLAGRAARRTRHVTGQEHRQVALSRLGNAFGHSKPEAALNIHTPWAWRAGASPDLVLNLSTQSLLLL